jgi:hypothetical protein
MVKENPRRGQIDIDFSSTSGLSRTLLRNFFHMSTLAFILSFMSLFPQDLPTIHLPLGQWADLPTSDFTRSTDGSPADFPTTISLMADDLYLYVKFECGRDEFVHENHLTQHNEQLYNQEVFELFIAAGEADATEYLEFEINPNNAVWVGKITNPGLGGGAFSGELVSYETCGIQHEAVKGEDSWSGSFSIPWALVPGGRQGQYRLNFYRIVSTKSHPNEDWVCGDDCEFLCWSTTMSGAEPAFHRPRRFGYLTITH